MDFLRRENAPIASAAWEAIDDQARDVLRTSLSARSLVGVDGPHGFEHAALNLGRLDPASVEAAPGLYYGVRKVLPLVEVRVPFSLDLWQLDDVVRGARDPDLDPLVEAAHKLARFEERAIYYGFSPAGIEGIAQASTHARVELAKDSTAWPSAIAHASVRLGTSGFAPPHALVVGSKVFEEIAGDAGQYPLRKELEALVGSPLVVAPHVDCAFLVRADARADFELVLGHDIAIGFEAQHGTSARLYLTESFTFRVVDPAAVVVFESAA